MTRRLCCTLVLLTVTTSGCTSSSCPPCAEPRCPEGTPGAAAAPNAPAAVAAGPPAAGMVRVAAGAFLRGSPEGVGLEDERPQRSIHLDTFDIDRTEVPLRDYQKCVAAQTCAPPECGEPEDKAETRPDHPVVCVSWAQAKAYCEWAGKRLPTEAEWEKAARGDDGRLFPWGNQAPSCELANHSGCGEGTHPVGSKTAGASPHGALDMAGNVYEWVADWHHEAYYELCPDRNPPGPPRGDKKIVRGGAFSYAADELTVHGRTFDRPEVAYDQVGFRCARSVAP